MATLVAYLISFSMAFLLFVVQPMATKVILPQFGGTPAVWNTAMLCFQVLLLLGYLYAHFLTSLLKPRAQIITHAALIACACMLLPIAFTAPDAAEISHAPIRSLVWQLLQGVGIPFFCVAATAPLLQRWVSYSQSSLAAKPYVLYSASNLGSMSALIGYIALIEPNAPVSLQMAGWGYGFIAVSAMLIAFATRMSAQATASQGQGMGWSQVPAARSLLWVALAFIPSSLSLGLTTHITIDIASVPFFWVLTFAIYLLSFVDAFAAKPRFVPLAKRIAPFMAVLCLVLLTDMVHVGHGYVILPHILGFSTLAFAIHGHLAERKPEVAYLTWYYVCLSIGGALGGVFNAIAAPMLLNSIFEYKVVLCAAALVGYVLTYKKWRLLFVLVAVGLLALMVLRAGKESLLKERNFYGVSRVYEREGKRYLQHNTTIHGLQSLDPAYRLSAASYYSALPMIMPHRAPAVSDAPIAAIGLGIGVVKCQTNTNQHMDLFEINPLVVRIAQDVNLFTYLSDCKGAHDIILGDGRLTMAQMPHEKYGTIIIDAFSSDAIPVHLLTKEAFAMYLDKLMPEGVLIIHITNRHLELNPLIGLQAQASGMVAYTKHFEGDNSLTYPSDWVVLARDEATLSPIIDASNGWWKLVPEADTNVWTDDYTNILPYLKKLR
ncbi:MAG: fused MFS/spermidine synthase [Alphaproteobacteria bacterium]|nr:fused MFS/spermidine synthase [Alphaproteobacteria bacterium]